MSERMTDEQVQDIEQLSKVPKGEAGYDDIESLAVECLTRGRDLAEKDVEIARLQSQVRDCEAAIAFLEKERNESHR